ncbi:D-alanyl-D-alanine carboxypeptidase [Roseibium hamelinense]|uniref:D-alanyl-D-alanine carboxypeptidase n=1 Tax=Roseibium hamelinense TaxID=150831 RepID=A0A562T9C5_9HYPH|nr:D-alanyl-D-alanine carboxypeptidase family protein [Roseibium hamelinense]MTI45372.1 D-alanyl-D-alanine carboxypeptidase [Roseibium hamelinense]TWI90257.1 D-alanyl-D-alanine carboxypeptidase [Roseibium hamelinense]
MTISHRIRHAASWPVRLIAIAAICLSLAACQTAGTVSQTAPVQGAPVQSAAISAPSQIAPVAYAPSTAVPQGYSALVIDMSSGRELFSENADAARFPASLTKMMTLYLLYEEIASGRLSRSTPLQISENAAAQPPSKIGIRPGMTMTVDQAARALSVKSGNDVAIAVAETVAGSEDAFVRRMNAKARSLGMTRTRFTNPSGLPDTAQVTTARDMAKLGLALKRRFPQYASYYRAQSFTFNGRTYRATNNLLGKVRGVDGLKTGYIRLSGYNLVATARRGGQQRMVIVMGGRSEAARDTEVTRLIEAHF